MPTWETAADWDAAQSETGVHHEQPAATDWAAADKVEKGYPSFDEGGTSLVSYVPFQDASGPVNDVANANSYSTANASFGQTGVLGNSCIEFPNGTNQDEVNLEGVLDGLSTFTICLWFNRPSSASFPTSAGDETIISVNDDLDSSFTTGWELYIEDSNDTYKVGKSKNSIQTGVTVSDGNWDFVVMAYDGSALEIFINDSLAGTDSSLNYDIGNTYNSYIGHGTQQGEERNLTGRVGHFRAYSRLLSRSEITDRYNTVAGTSSYVSSKKTL